MKLSDYNKIFALGESPILFVCQNSHCNKSYQYSQCFILSTICYGALIEQMKHVEFLLLSFINSYDLTHISPVNNTISSIFNVIAIAILKKTMLG